MRLPVALSLVVLAVSASASPVANPTVFTIPLARLQRTGAYLKGSPDADRARAALMKSYAGSDGPTTVPSTNLAYMQYTTSVGIGNPPTYYNLVVDTGSSNTFCGTGKQYVRTKTSIPTGENVSVTYGQGYFSGVEYLDQIELAPNLVIVNQSIGDALADAYFVGVDGIIGVGPVDLTRGTLFPDLVATIPTVMNNLVSQGLVKNQILGVYFAPPTKYSDTNGALTYGGIDSSLYEGEITYVPLTETSPASRYWGINVTSVAYGTHAVFRASTAGIVDTGTTQILIADDSFDTYMKAIPGATFNSSLGLIDIPTSSVASMKPLIFKISGRQFAMDVAAQLVPTDQNEAWGGVAGKQYGVVGKIGSNSGAGLDFIIGQKFMERYYAVFDADAKRVGFARTNNTFSKIIG